MATVYGRSMQGHSVSVNPVSRLTLERQQQLVKGENIYAVYQGDGHRVCFTSGGVYASSGSRFEKLAGVSFKRLMAGGGRLY